MKMKGCFNFFNQINDKKVSTVKKILDKVKILLQIGKSLQKQKQ